MSAPKILIVENNINFLDTLKEYLEITGYLVIPAREIKQAEKLASEKRFVAAIVDVRMKDQRDVFDWSGLVLARHLAGSKIPVIILSAFDEQEDINRAYTVAPGVPPPYAFISKNQPDWGTKLVEMLQEIIGDQKTNKLNAWLSQNWAKILDTILKLLRRR